MFSMSISEFLMTTALVLLGLGGLSLVIGLIILATRVLGSDVKTLATQTAKLAQKGIVEDFSGVIGNASALVQSLEQLVRTAAGVGIFLALLGILLIAGAYFVVTNIP